VENCGRDSRRVKIAALLLHVFTDEKGRTAHDRPFRLVPVITREAKTDA